MGEEGRREEERGKGEGRKRGDQKLVTVICSIHEMYTRVPACTHLASATCVW